ncbi:cobyric acid synthase [Cryobacterium sp. SO2]|uniref:type 1 glutamine amidotransferase n=1 Tax=Cryobacterium sp. SO2 TaxID=1897060 RepID=UPI00223DBB27|nr:cobyric acid synthase [Cryobacterium sp. SO2]WEO79158.1 cobyric acid synthase [Cryobacterium sp. SO2]
MTVAPSAELTILSVLPRLLDTNGDAANARVLAQRARWAGIAARVVDVHTTADLPDTVDLVVIGSGTDTDLDAARAALLPLADAFGSWLAGGVPTLAVGTGWELLSAGIDLPGGTRVDGLGLVAGHATLLAARATDDIAVDASDARLIGFENHARGYTGAAHPLGRVLAGTGNGTGDEGLVQGSFIGTHLHGPVLARNPQLADRMLSSACAARGLAQAASAHTVLVDGTAKAARNQVAVRLGLSSE